MEILSSSTDRVLHYSLISILGILAILFLILSFMFFLEIIRTGLDGAEDLIGLACFVIMGASLSIGVYSGVQKGPTTTYKVIIDDFNEVYQSGYKIVGNDGDIYLIEKE